MNRPSRDEALLVTALVWAERSTCSRLQVGAVVAREGRVLVQGYNGAPAGLPHCNHECTCHKYEGYPMHREGLQGPEEVHRYGCPAPEPCTISVHAEQNAIAFAARYGVALDGAELVTTHQPCAPCAMSIINAGITKVTYLFEYRLKTGIEMLTLAGVEVVQAVEPANLKVV